MAPPSEYYVVYIYDKDISSLQGAGFFTSSPLSTSWTDMVNNVLEISSINGEIYYNNKPLYKENSPVKETDVLIPGDIAEYWCSANRPEVKPVDKLNILFTGIADAIRSKTGSTEKIKPNDFATEIAGMNVGGGGENNKSFSIEDINCPEIFEVGETISFTVKDLTDKNFADLTVGIFSNTSATCQGQISLYYGGAQQWMLPVGVIAEASVTDIGAGKKQFQLVIRMAGGPSNTFNEIAFFVGNNCTRDISIVTTVPTMQYICIVENTLITLSDGTQKYVQDIDYNDELLVWDFYEGKFTSAKPNWIKIEQIANEYNKLTFSDGTTLGLVGQGNVDDLDKAGYHRIFNKQAGAFTHTGTDETPIGTITFNHNGKEVTLISQEIIHEPIKYYNLTTEKYYNCFANSILTSCRLSNEYQIKDMKYTGERLLTDEDVQKWYEEHNKLRRDN